MFGEWHARYLDVCGWYRNSDVYAHDRCRGKRSGHCWRRINYDWRSDAARIGVFV
jgi:hypothetical protein